MLASREASVRIEKVRIEVAEDRAAQIEVTFKDRQRPSVVEERFSDALVAELFEARIPYSVMPPGVSATGRTLSATDFRALIETEPTSFESIRIESTGPVSARYVVTRKGESERSVYAEYPGTIVRAIKAHEIPLR